MRFLAVALSLVALLLHAGCGADGTSKAPPQPNAGADPPAQFKGVMYPYEAKNSP